MSAEPGIVLLGKIGAVIVASLGACGAVASLVVLRSRGMRSSPVVVLLQGLELCDVIITSMLIIVTVPTLIWGNAETNNFFQQYRAVYMCIYMTSWGGEAS